MERKGELTRGKGMIGQAIGYEGIQAGTEDAKVLDNEDGIHYNQKMKEMWKENWKKKERSRRRIK